MEFNPVDFRFLPGETWGDIWIKYYNPAGTMKISYHIQTKCWFIYKTHYSPWKLIYSGLIPDKDFGEKLLKNVELFKNLI